MDAVNWPPVAVWGGAGAAPFVLLCEHASSFIPPVYEGLGIADEARTSHVAWDIGALDMATRMSAGLQAPLVAGQISRLVYDCNRPLEAPDCIPEVSEVFAIPGNCGLTQAQRQQRFDQIHTPFHAAVRGVMDKKELPVALITLHSFTPVYFGKTRDVELGFLFHNTGALAEACVQVETAKGRYKAEINAPYSASDGVTYSLQQHGEARGVPSVMIEVRNDLIDTPAKAEVMADHLSDTLVQAMALIEKESAA